MKAGEFYKFVPDKQWCREGFAKVVSTSTGLALVDTYWDTTSNVFDHGLSDAEQATLELLFTLEEFRELHDSGSKAAKCQWERYAEQDRQMITSQHGLQCRRFVRKDARPCLAMEIQNARFALTRAEQEVTLALQTVKWRRRELAQLEARSR